MASTDRRAAKIEALAREAYDRCHPGDSFADMKRRARFSKEDRCLLRDWLTFAERRLNEGSSGKRERRPRKG